MIRQANDLQMVTCLKEVRQVLGKAPKAPLHFVDLKHKQRAPYIRRVGEGLKSESQQDVYRPRPRRPASADFCSEYFMRTP